MEAEDDSRRGIFGNLPGTDQGIPRAELYAIMMALMKSDGTPIRIFTDHWNHFATWKAGRHACLANWAKPHLDLWQVVWRVIDDIGDDNVAFHWVKAHQSVNNAEDPEHLQRIVMNKEADKLANLGRSVHDLKESTIREIEWLT